MGYHHVDPADLDPAPDRPSRQLSISDACGLDHFAAHVYEVEPGEGIPLAYHYHDEQEELFYVTEGTLHVETPDGDYAVEAGEAFVVEPGSPQRAHNPEHADETLRTLAIGAPRVDDVHAYEP